MEHNFLEQSSTNGQKLFSQICDFNFFPNRYWHPDWSRLFGQENGEITVTETQGSESCLAFKILSFFGVNGHFHFDFSNPRLRLVLLNRDELGKLLFLAGFAAIHHELRMREDEENSYTAQEDLSLDFLANFALEKAPFLVGDLIAPLPLAGSGLGWRCCASLNGILLLGACIGTQRKPLIRRLQLKLPANHAHRIQTHAPAHFGNKAWLLLRKILVNDVSPTWGKLWT